MIPKLSPVEVEWIDSLDSDQGYTWQEYDQAIHEKCGDRLYTTGYLLKRDKKYLWLVKSYHISGQIERVRVGRSYLIPLGCIIKVRRLS